MQRLRDWETETLQDGKYKRSSDVYQVGIMLQQWLDMHPEGSDVVAAGVIQLKSHEKTAAAILATSPWLADARIVFLGGHSLNVHARQGRSCTV